MAILRDPAAPAAKRDEAMRAILELMKGADPVVASVAGQFLASIADHLTPAEIAILEREYAAAAPGAVTRPWLAGAVARGIAGDPRLAAFLAGLPPVEEPDIRSAVLRSLDTAPSAAYREWFIRLTREERDLGVLDDAWDEDRLLAAATRDDAPRIATAIEGRLGDGSVKERPLRGLGYYAISIAGIQAPELASAALDRCLAAETDAAVRALGQALVVIVRSGDATFAALEAVWDKHQRLLRTP